jgi:hypothetical protein
MTEQDYTASFTVDATADEVFSAMTNVRGWWSEDIEGETDRPGAIFFYRFKDVHRGTFKITEFVPGERVVWHVLQNRFNFVADSTEWTGTDIVFELREHGPMTEFTFTHVGLNPAEECYEVCHDAWTFYVRKSLYDLITQGAGEPNRSDALSENHPVPK